MKGLSPVLFEDYVKPYQINLEEVNSFFLLTSKENIIASFIINLEEEFF